GRETDQPPHRGRDPARRGAGRQRIPPCGRVQLPDPFVLRHHQRQQHRKGVIVMSNDASQTNGAAPTHSGGRTGFTTSRVMEYFTEKELTLQIGHALRYWPLALLKEILDNALDACETAGVDPEIEVVLGDDFFSVQDNGSGLPESTLLLSLDYTVRVS